jgi:hypothetical protein
MLNAFIICQLTPPEFFLCVSGGYWGLNSGPNVLSLEPYPQSFLLSV